MSLVRCVPLSRKTHIRSDMCYPTQETHISSDITSDMCSPIRETHAISDMGIPGVSIPGVRENTYYCDMTVIYVAPLYLFPRTHIASDTWKHISLVICVPLPGKHISLVICVFWLGEHTSH